MQNNGYIKKAGGPKIELVDAEARRQLSTLPTDVQVDGTSVVTDGVANIPIATNGNVGAVKIGASWQTALTNLSDGTLQVAKANDEHISNRYPHNCGAIMPSNLDYAVKIAMTDGKGAAWTEAEQEAARTRLGITGTGGSNITKLSELENDLGFVTGDVITVSSEAPDGEDTKVWIKDADNEEVELLTPSDLENYYTKSEVDDALPTNYMTLDTEQTATAKKTIPKIETGTATDAYFQSRKFRGEGNASTYYHAIDFGYQSHDMVDFYEYGGVWNFWKNTSSNATNAVANQCLKIELDGVSNKGNKYVFPNKAGTFALTSDLPSDDHINNLIETKITQDYILNLLPKYDGGVA